MFYFLIWWNILYHLVRCMPLFNIKFKIFPIPVDSSLFIVHCSLDSGTSKTINGNADVQSWDEFSKDITLEEMEEINNLIQLSFTICSFNFPVRAITQCAYLCSKFLAHPASSDLILSDTNKNGCVTLSIDVYGICIHSSWTSCLFFTKPGTRFIGLGNKMNHSHFELVESLIQHRNYFDRIVSVQSPSNWSLFHWIEFSSKEKMLPIWFNSIYICIVMLRTEIGIYAIRVFISYYCTMYIKDRDINIWISTYTWYLIIISFIHLVSLWFFATWLLCIQNSIFDFQLFSCWVSYPFAGAKT